MFEMRREPSIGRQNSPFVGRNPRSPRAPVYHWLQRQGHPFLEFYTLTRLSEIGHLRVFVHLPAYSMAGVFPHYRETSLLHKLLNRRRNVSKPVATPRHCDPCP